MSTPSDSFPQDDTPHHEQPTSDQRYPYPSGAAPQEDGRQPSNGPDTGPGQRVRWPAAPPTQQGSTPGAEAPHQPLPPPPTRAPAPPPSRPQHAAPHGAPTFKLPEPARPNTQQRQPDPAWQPGDEASIDKTAEISLDQIAAHRGQPPQDEQGLDGFFSDTPQPHEQHLPAGWPSTAPSQPPSADPHQPLFADQPSPPAAFAPSGYGALDEGQQFVTSRRRPVGKGWRKLVSQMTFGLITPGPSAKQEEHDKLIRSITAPLLDVYVVAFVSAKGGVGKTTMTVAAGSAIARERGDRVIAVDVDTDLGNLSSRFEQKGGADANIEALSSLQDASSYPTVATFTVQNKDRLEMLGAQNNPRSSYTLNTQDFEATMKILKKHYNVILLDCGTAITSPLFSTIANHVDSLVVVASQAPDGLNGAWTTVQWLQAHGFARLLPRTVIALNSTFKNKPLVDLDDAEQEFTAKIPGVSVVRIPYDVHLAEGRDVTFVELKSRARKALMALAGSIAQHYPARGPHQHRTTQTGGF